MAWSDLGKYALHHLKVYTALASNPTGTSVLQQQGIPHAGAYLRLATPLLGLSWVLISSAGLVSVCVGAAVSAVASWLSWCKLRREGKLRKEDTCAQAHIERSAWDIVVVAASAMLLATAGFTQLCFVQGSMDRWQSVQLTAVLLAVAVLQAGSESMVASLFHCIAMLLLVNQWVWSAPLLKSMQLGQVVDAQSAAQAEAWLKLMHRHA